MRYWHLFICFVCPPSQQAILQYSVTTAPRSILLHNLKSFSKVEAKWTVNLCTWIGAFAAKHIVLYKHKCSDQILHFPFIESTKWDLTDSSWTHWPSSSSINTFHTLSIDCCAALHHFYVTYIQPAIKHSMIWKISFQESPGQDKHHYMEFLPQITYAQPPSTPSTVLSKSKGIKCKIFRQFLKILDDSRLRG